MSKNFEERIANLSPIKRELLIRRMRATVGVPLSVQAELKPVLGSLPFTDGQNWFLEKFKPSNPHCWNIVELLEPSQPLKRDILEQAIRYLLWYHDGLRIRFIPEQLGWRQFIVELEEALPFTWIDISEQTEEEKKATIKRTAVTLCDSLNIVNGPLMRIIYFDFGYDQPGRLLWVIHHLITDAWSNEILFQDLQIAYQQLDSKKDILLTSKTTSLKQFTERLVDFIHSVVPLEHLDSWLQLPWSKVLPLPIDKLNSMALNTVGSSRYIQTFLSSDETNILLTRGLNTDTQIMDVLLTALILATTRWTNSSLLHVNVANHGRMVFDELDMSHTVGWLSFGVHLILNLEGTYALEDALKAIKRQLRLVPTRDLKCNLLYSLNKDLQVLERFKHISFAGGVHFNYFGQIKQKTAGKYTMRRSQDTFGINIGLQQDSHEIVEETVGCEAMIIDGQLAIEWRYSENLHFRSTIEYLAQCYLDALRDLKSFIAD